MKCSSLFSPVIAVSLSTCLIGFVNAEVITQDKELGSTVTTATDITEGKAGIAIKNSSQTPQTPLAITLNAGGTNVSAINNGNGSAFGIHADGDVKFDGSKGKQLTFDSITASSKPTGQSQLAVGIRAIGKLNIDNGVAMDFKKIENRVDLVNNNAIGIYASDLVLSNGASLKFEAIQRSGGKYNSDAYGIYTEPSQALNLTIESRSSIRFDEISATGGSDQTSVTAAGIVTGIQGASSIINVKNGTLSFGTISAAGSAGGIGFQATQNSLDGNIAFEKIISEKSFAIGLGFVSNVSATLKEGSKIFIESMKSNTSNNVFPIRAEGVKSLVFERNAGLFYGVISDEAKAHSYGIYAKMDQTLQFRFGAGETASKDTGTTFQNIQATAGNAYGFYLSGSATEPYGFNVDGKATFDQIQADAGSAYGIYADRNLALDKMINDNNGIIAFKSIHGGGGSVGIGIDARSELKIRGAKLNFTDIQTSGAQGAYAIKNKGTLIINGSGLLSFGNVANNPNELSTSGIYNAQNGLTYAFGTTKIEGKLVGRPQTDLNYGFYHKTGTASFSGSFEVSDFQASSANFSVIKSETSSTLNLDNFTLGAYGNKTGANLIGFNGQGGNVFKLSLANTLTINLMKDADKYEALNSPRNESVAFGENVTLALKGKDAKVIFNADGGKLTKLSHEAGARGGIILLSGEGSGGNSQEYSNRIWKDGSKRNFNARHLTIDNLETQGATFVLYADKNAKVANMPSSIYGKAYKDGAKTKVDRTEFGGSDSIHVGSTQSQTPIDNTLRIALGGLNRENKKEVQNVILASVGKDGQDKVIFNSLQKSGDSVKTESYVGFDVAELTIKRYDLKPGEQANDFAGIGSIYYSDLVAENARINSQYLAPIFNSLNINFFTFSANLNSLSKRLGDLKNDANSHGVWARMFGGEQVANFGIKTNQSYVATQVGYDYGFDLSDAKNYLGVALSYSYGKSLQAKANYAGAQGLESYQNSANTHGIEVALYNTYKANSGLYSDSIVKLGYLMSDIDFYKNKKVSNHSNIAVALSEEIGYEVGLGENKEWMITPQAEFAYAFMNGSEFSQTQTGGSLGATSDALHLLRMRAGANWGYRFNHAPDSTKVKTLLYVGTYYEYDVISGGDMKFTSSNHNSANYNALTSNGRFVLNLGTDMQVQESTRLYIDFEKSFGSSLQKEYQVNFGVRYAFGEGKQEMEDKEDKAPLRLKDKEDKVENTEEMKKSESAQEEAKEDKTQE